MCIVKSCSEECRRPGRRRPAEAVGVRPGAASPPFFSLISTRRGSPISMKKVLFFSYSSSSITLTAIVLLKQRRIEVGERGKRHAEEHRREESKVRRVTENLSSLPGGHRITSDQVQFSTLISLSSACERKAEKYRL